jgi:hypothetical protein
MISIDQIPTDVLIWMEKWLASSCPPPRISRHDNLEDQPTRARIAAEVARHSIYEEVAATLSGRQHQEE